MRRTPALIVGAGPAGTAAAIVLARAGLPHLVVERQREVVDALCGGFLSWRTLDRLRSLGVEPDALNPHRVNRLRLVAGNRIRTVPLPRPALAVSRHRLDTLLLDRAIAAGAVVERGVAVRRIDGMTAQLDDAAALATDALFLASGKHEVRGAARDAARAADPTLGLRVRLGPAAGLDRMIGDAIELHLIDGGYAGLVRQEDGSANLCMAIRGSRLRDAGSPAALLDLIGAASPPLRDRLGHCAAGQPVDAVANVPYGWRARRGEAGLFRLGDQAAVIPSLAGEGIGIALASGIGAALAYRRGGAAAGRDWQAGFARSVARPMALAGAARSLVEREWLAGLIGWVPAGLIQAVARGTRVAAEPSSQPLVASGTSA